MSIVPSVLLNNLPTWKANVYEFCDDYAGDIPNAVGLYAELELWQRMWVQKKGRIPYSEERRYSSKNIRDFKSCRPTIIP